MKSFDFERTAWIVSDLKSKYEVQKSILARSHYFLDTSVLRASDLWKLFCKYEFPEVHVTSSPVFKALVSHYLTQNKQMLGVNERSAASVLLYLNQLGGLLFHPRRTEIVADFFEQNTHAEQSWKDWYLRALATHLFIFEKEKRILAKQIPALLQNSLNLNKYWTKSLIIDLGTEVSHVEMDLFNSLAVHCDVTLLRPQFDDTKAYAFLEKPYQRIESYAKITEALPVVMVEPKVNKTQRFSSMLAEIKYVTEEIRKLFESGVALANISVMAADVEAYWPSLKLFFDKEGILANKNLVLRLQSILSVQTWLAHLSIKVAEVKSHQLETEIFSRNEKPIISYNDFKYLFGLIYDAEDLLRDEKVQMAYQAQPNYNDKIALDQFIVFSLRHWSDEEQSENIATLFKTLLEMTESQVSLTLKEWLNLLKDLVSQKEILVEEGSDVGVQVCSVMSSQGHASKYQFILGLTEEQMSTKQKSLVKAQDAWSFLNSFDIEIQNEEESFHEFEVQWLLERNEAYITLCCPLSHFDGSLQNPSSLFIKVENSLGSNKSLFSQPNTRWDQIQSHVESHESDKKTYYLQDLGLEKRNVQPINDLTQIALNATSMERYFDCPFIFAAEKVFRLRDVDAIDIELTAMSRGSTLHKIFELIYKHHPDLELDDKDLDEVLELARIQSKEFLVQDSYLWQSYKVRFKKIAIKFIEFEKQWHKTFAGTKVDELEKAFEFYFDLHDKKLYTEAGVDRIKINGKIDRVDRFNNEHFIVIDYKSSSPQAHNFASWLKGLDGEGGGGPHLQLLFYVWVLEKFFLKDIDYNVIGAFYYIYNKLNRERGMGLDTYENQAFPPLGRNVKATEGGKEEALQNFEELLGYIVDKIKQADFTPKPRDFKMCKTCDWRSLCRAPHLN